jgi:hypothetical protein
LRRQGNQNENKKSEKIFKQSDCAEILIQSPIPF